MSKEKPYKKKGQKNTRAKEPEVSFKTLRIFSSFEEQEEEEIRWLASLTPEEHLQNTTALIKRVFSDQLKRHPEIGTQIYFD